MLAIINSDAVSELATPLITSNSLDKEFPMKKPILTLLMVAVAALLVAGCQPTLAAVAVSQEVPSKPALEPADVSSQQDNPDVGSIGPASDAPATSPVEETARTDGAAEQVDAAASTSGPLPQMDSFEDKSKPGTISVTGQGQASASPDVAILELGVETIAETVQEARAESAKATTKLIDALTELGVAEDDIGTRSVRIKPRMNRETQTVTGYEVSNRLVVKIRDLEIVGAAIDEAAAAAGDSTRLRGIDFSVEDTSSMEKDARAAAVDDATDKAEQLAKRLGVTVGRVISVNESDFGGIPFPRAAAEFGLAVAQSADTGTPVLAGDVEITVTVLAEFEIEEPESP